MREIKSYLEQKLKSQKKLLKIYKEDLDFAAIVSTAYEGRLDHQRIIINFIEKELKAIK